MTQDLWTWSERRQKARDLVDPYRKRKGGEVYGDGTNVKAKRCECLGPKTFDSSEGRCVKCGREPSDNRRYRL